MQSSTAVPTKRSQGCKTPWTAFEEYAVAKRFWKQDLTPDKSKREGESIADRVMWHEAWVISVGGDGSEWWRTWAAMEQKISERRKQGKTLSDLKTAADAEEAMTPLDEDQKEEEEAEGDEAEDGKGKVKDEAEAEGEED